MKIAMFTNLYLPIVGGVSISVERFSEAYRERHHDVLIVAPRFPGQPDREEHVLRIPAIQEFNGTDFSVALPPGHELKALLNDFAPDLIHSHHPFLLGDAAVREANRLRIPLVYTHHTMYEHYTHYVPMDCRLLRDFVVQLATRYTDFCSLVIVPSESVARILRQRGVASPIRVVPTGVEPEQFEGGSAREGRRKAGIDPDCPIIGHVGRLAEEKNLAFLTRAVSRAMEELQDARFLVVGAGDMEQTMERMLRERGLGDRAVFAGSRGGRDLSDFYAAMDVFVFASKTETQGMVLAEALTARTPVVALDAPGAREVVEDRRQGRLVGEEDEGVFAEAVAWVLRRPDDERTAMQSRARDRADAFSLGTCVDMALDAYEQALRASPPTVDQHGEREWDRLRTSIRSQWDIWRHRAASLVDAIERRKPHGDDP